MSTGPTSSEGKALRIDLLIAVCALLVSTLATAASWWQSRVVATQLSSQVWPYLSIVSTIGPAGLEVDVANDGLGPAVVRSVVLSVDRKPYAELSAAVRALVGPSAPRPQGTFASVPTGSVIRAGATLIFIRIRNLALVRLIAERTQRVDLQVCYCSILGDCWIRTLQRADPERLGACPYDPGTNYRGVGGGA
ncbi:MAG: hypothetical protein JOZ24_02505 [Candidatus Eremiobacteraeota bacterium]|nr:hypothetical protein [Candidatus Eremiobacteraeota bacterium]